jgi:NAD(P)-dependent dehydrogenase (short-subunit alcohol dehydrogenase family)
MKTSSLKYLAMGTAACLAGRALIRRYRRFEFASRVILVMGGSRGLGLVLARKLVQQNARVVVCARDKNEVDAACRDIESFAYSRAEVMGLECDVTDFQAVQQAYQTVCARWGHVDVLINNAGVIQVGPLSEMMQEDFEHAMNVHYWGPLHAIRNVLPEMQARGEGRIVNIASIGGKVSVPHLLPYCGSKFALVGLSEGLRAALLEHGIYVTTVCPGLMRTGSFLHATFSGQNEAEFTWFSASASAPVLSISAQRAADQIIDACRYGQSEVVLSWPAKLLSLIHGIAPGFVADTMGLVNQMLPHAANGQSVRNVAGHESRPDWLPDWVTSMGDNAAAMNNELKSSQLGPSQARPLGR